MKAKLESIISPSVISNKSSPIIAQKNVGFVAPLLYLQKTFVSELLRLGVVSRRCSGGGGCRARCHRCQGRPYRTDARGSYGLYSQHCFCSSTRRLSVVSFTPQQSSRCPYQSLQRLLCRSVQQKWQCRQRLLLSQVLCRQQ